MISLRKSFQWQKLNKKRTGFLWAMTGMAAAQMGDINNLVELIGNYETEYCKESKISAIHRRSRMDMHGMREIVWII